MSLVISCVKKTEDNNVRSYVANHPVNKAEAVKYTPHKDEAHSFDNFGTCTNVRDDVLEFARDVTILRF